MQLLFREFLFRIVLFIQNIISSFSVINHLCISLIKKIDLIWLECMHFVYEKRIVQMTRVLNISLIKILHDMLVLKKPKV